MATEFVYLEGKTKWFRANQPDPWGNWKHDLYLTPASVEKFNALKTTSSGVSGVKNELKKDEDGYYVAIRRPTQKMMKGKVVGFAPPQVVDKEGKPFNDPVGNGSDVTTKVAVYTHGTPGGGKARALRWEATRIDNHVPFKKDEDFPTHAKEQVEGLSDQPEALF